MDPPRRHPPRVLFLFTEVCVDGGIQRFNQTVLDACAHLGIHCLVLSLNDSDVHVRKRLVQAKLSAVGFSGSRSRFALAAAGALLRGGYERVFIGHINFLALVVTVLTLRPFHRVPVMLIAHGIEVWSGIGIARRYTLGRVARILCVSQYTRRRILEQAPGLRAERLAIFPNSLADTWRHVPAVPLSRPLPERFILSVTRLTRGDRYKGIVSVIDALSMLTDDTIHYVIIGHGDDLPFLHLIAERCGVKNRVHFLRGISDSELITLYQRCEAFVLPSGKEGFGIVFLEAMFFGAPVVAAREKGALDVVSDGETGLTVRFGDTIAIKEAIERITSDLELRERLRANGRSTVTNGGPFTFARFIGRCSDVFEVDKPTV